MRLICGFYHLDGQPAQAARLASMLEAMVEPGLTPQRTHLIDGPVALGVLDFQEAVGALPRTPEGAVMAADAQIHVPAVGGQTRLLDALCCPGIEKLGGVIGEFAAAVWNGHSRILNCARDGMGVRPFFFTHQPGKVFAFASLPRGIHAGAFVARSLNQDFLINELLGRMPRAQHSLFQGIERLGAGERIRVSATGIQRDVHWRLPRELGGQYTEGPGQAAEEMASLLGEAVRCRLPACGPVGAHLSGGLDSSPLAILAARQLRESGRRVFAYSFLPGSVSGLPLQGERPYIDAVLRQEPDIVYRPFSITDPMAYLFPRMDGDQAMPCDPQDPEIKVCMDAAANGISTIFSGWGGDEGVTFNGRGVLAQAMVEGRWGYLVNELRALQRLRGFSLTQLLRAELLPFLFSGRLREQIRRWRGIHRFDALHALLLQAPADSAPPIRLGANALDNRWQLLAAQPHLMNRMERWALMGARHGIAFTFPMLDRRVLELAWSLPGSNFLRDGWKRRVIRDAMAGVLPTAIAQRHTKLSPFPEIITLQVMNREALLAALDDLGTHPRVRELFDLRGIRLSVEQLPVLAQARQMTLGEDRQRMITGNAMRLLSLFHVMAYVRQHH